MNPLEAGGGVVGAYLGCLALTTENTGSRLTSFALGFALPLLTILATAENGAPLVQEISAGALIGFAIGFLGSSALQAFHRPTVHQLH